MTDRVDTVVIGAGQAGLCTSYYLTQQGREHLVLEQASILAPAWHKRWDSFTLVTTNWTLQLPDFDYQGDEPDGFLTKGQVIEYLEQFAATFDPPVRFSVRVTSVERKSESHTYIVHSNDGTIEVDNVVVANGTFQEPRIPAFSAQLPEEIGQLHTSDYQNPEALPEGAVLVVGSGQSGCQIAEELYQSGRRVYLSVGRSVRLPRRYRGQDMGRWMDQMGFFDQTVDTLPSPAARFGSSGHVSGKGGGRTLNLHQFARDGVVLLGHVEDVRGNRITLVPDLHENLANADRFAAEMLQRVDKLIEQQGLDAPQPIAEPQLQDGFEQEQIRELDLRNEGIRTIIWATGYKFDFSLVKLPILDDFGYPVHKRGVTEYPGLYFVGLHWLYKIKSALLYGVGEDAAHIANHIASRDGQ